MMKKPKLLCILHVPPPAHGASKVGEFIRSSDAINSAFECRYIPIRSSDTIGDIDKANLKKFYFVAELFVKIAWALIVFRPEKIYFTASVKSLAFYRDVLLSSLWKLYSMFTSVEVFYHYHTKGIDNFVSASARNLALTRWFVRDVNLILLSPMLESDFAKAKTYKRVLFLPNGVEDPIAPDSFEPMIQKRLANNESTNILYLSNMIKSKGYFEVLKLASLTRDQSIRYHFAGGWQNSEDEAEFFDYIATHNLQNSVTFHGFVNGEQKRALFERAHLFIFPTRYPNEAFPLSILEAFSYGLPVIATDEASIPSILDDHSGIIVSDLGLLEDALERAQSLISSETACYCRERYEQFYTLRRFEENFIHIFQSSF